MPAGILDDQAQIAASLVQVERARLEDRLVLAPVEIPEGNEVVTELDEVAVIVCQPLQADDRRGIAFLGFVFGDERGERLLGLAGQDLAHALRARASPPSRRPWCCTSVIRGELGDQVAQSASVRALLSPSSGLTASI